MLSEVLLLLSLSISFTLYTILSSAAAILNCFKTSCFITSSLYKLFSKARSPIFCFLSTFNLFSREVIWFLLLIIVTMGFIDTTTLTIIKRIKTTLLRFNLVFREILLMTCVFLLIAILFRQ